MVFKFLTAKLNEKVVSKYYQAYRLTVKVVNYTFSLFFATSFFALSNTCARSWSFRNSATCGKWSAMLDRRLMLLTSSVDDPNDIKLDRVPKWTLINKLNTLTIWLKFARKNKLHSCRYRLPAYHCRWVSRNNRTRMWIKLTFHFYWDEWKPHEFTHTQA